ncbi:ubiquitin-like FUBI-ribosomal protein eS30 fusion protein [Leptodactylus fuscus]|uniref:ubiquitin-like FUBI-ribosomal protein eS30 fusion protein n=1 Tax=Leptodactylus fuscus TaxID=238119 RepID=UPI003F4EEB11
MQIFITGQTLHTLDVSNQDTVFDIKTHIAELEGLLDCDLIVSFSGLSLEDEAVLSECGVQDQCTLNVTGRLLGGKVHGSLARAGKVRSQTPKVEKQEKKKKKTGRAKKRMLYNRRFVNGVPTYGKGKGPNFNS